MTKLKAFISLIVILCILPGCRSGRLYKGDPLPPSEVSIINGSGTIRGIYFVETNYKGQLISSSMVEVKPGLQELSVHFFDASKGPFYGAGFIITFQAEPGHEYVVKCDKKGYTWVEDINSGEVVYGEKRNE